MWRATSRRAIAAVLGVAFASGAQDAHARGLPISSDAYERRILERVNAERSQRGVRPLRIGRCVDAFASRWSTQLAKSRSLRHQPMRKVLDGCEARRAAENIGQGAISADRMVELWMRSRRHRAHLLDARFTRIGIGAARGGNGAWYAVTNFLAY